MSQVLATVGPIKIVLYYDDQPLVSTSGMGYLCSTPQLREKSRVSVEERV